jgi:hypothetical protein
MNQTYKQILIIIATLALVSIAVASPKIEPKGSTIIPTYLQLPSGPVVEIDYYHSIAAGDEILLRQDPERLFTVKCVRHEVLAVGEPSIELTRRVVYVQDIKQP